MAKRKVSSHVVEEFEGASLGDARRTRRLKKIVGALDRNPAAGFPQSMGSEAELEGFYRFINSESFTADDIMAPHMRATFDRAREVGEVVVVHDTTPVEFASESPREGLGWTTASGRQGFLAHASLVLAPDGEPLGVGRIETLTRSGKKQRARTVSHKVMREDVGRESLRWIRGVEAVEAQRAGVFEAVHVTDAEGDFYELLATLVKLEARFVIRAGQLDRLIEHEGKQRSLRSVACAIAPRVEREVALAQRKHKRRKVPESQRIKHPARDARMADLVIGSAQITIGKTKYSDLRSEPFIAHVVRVWEPIPPAGECAIEWVLLTTEPVDTQEDLERIVDIYRLRWMIEELFKALKTGCSLEKRQIESYEGLRKVLALLVPIAYRLLHLRALQRRHPEAPSNLAFSDVELHLMRSAPATQGLDVPDTIEGAMLLLARLGGHLKRNGPPGWMTLGRGYEQLLMLRLGWTLAHDAIRRSDQS